MQNPFRRRGTSAEEVAKAIDGMLAPMRTFAQALRLSGADPVLVGQWVQRAAAEFQTPGPLGPVERLFAERAREPLRRHGLLRDAKPDGDAGKAA
jgi:hypothetical protein